VRARQRPGAPTHTRRSPGQRGGQSDPARVEDYSSALPGDELLGELAQIADHQVWLWQAVNRERWITGPGDESGAHANTLGAEGIPDMGRHHHGIGGRHTELLAGVSVHRW
jgi:hypothetical protein